MSRSENGILNSEEEARGVEDDGCRRLLIAIIDRAISDVCGLIEQTDNFASEHQEDAIRWIFFDFHRTREWSLKWIAGELGRSFEKVRNGIFRQIERRFKRDLGDISFDSGCDVAWLATRWDHALRTIGETPWGIRELAKRKKMAHGKRYAEGFGKAWIGEWNDEENKRKEREGS